MYILFSQSWMNEFDRPKYRRMADILTATVPLVFGMNIYFFFYLFPNPIACLGETLMGQINLCAALFWRHAVHIEKAFWMHWIRARLSNRAQDDFSDSSFVKFINNSLATFVNKNTGTSRSEIERKKEAHNCCVPYRRPHSNEQSIEQWKREGKKRQNWFVNLYSIWIIQLFYIYS